MYKPMIYCDICKEWSFTTDGHGNIRCGTCHISLKELEELRKKPIYGESHLIKLYKFFIVNKRIREYLKIIYGSNEECKEWIRS